MGIGYFLGFLTSFMIFKIKKLEFENKILEKRILQERNKNKEKIQKEEKKEEPKIEEIKKENEQKEDQKEDKKEDKKEEVEDVKEEKKENNNENKNLDTVNEIIKDENKKPVFKPHEIKERPVVEEPWTVVRKKNKKKKD